MIKSKRGRKPKIKPQDQVDADSLNTTTEINNIIIDASNNPPGPKKRGRKPKGGKIISNLSNTVKIINIVPNIILHLNCNLIDVNKFFNCDLNYTPDIIEIETYNDLETNLFTTNYSMISNNSHDNINDIKELNQNSEKIQKTGLENKDIFNISQSTELEVDKENVFTNDDINSDKKSLIKNIHVKLTELAHKLHNNISDNKSACFWCTYNFDNPNIYIPINNLENKIKVYGCFCSPECAAAHLMNENIDSSTKFERYGLLNNIYGTIYNYKKNIKLAPNPYYILDKFCGNLSIQEYRNLSKIDNSIIILNKPLTRIYPELFEDTNINNNKYNIKKYL